MSRDIKSAKLIIIKGFLFLMTGLIAFGLICVNSENRNVILLTAICIWAFCQFYYFAFYVIENYVDSEYKFSGLYDFFKYLLKNHRK